MTGAIPDEHAGVGSALNDTVQQAGAALGVAVLGAVLSSTFTGHMPADAPAEARPSIGDALSVAGRADDTSPAASAHDAFTRAMSASFLAGAGGVVVAAVLAVFLMRDVRPVADRTSLVGGATSESTARLADVNR
ncbi:hypothetical protein [Streptomyces sp. NPDC002769]|uniref:hypothetical protein n=1 Tax=Streptomyces sp. NPDC002769 TaxID=3154542 RepID=UPI00332EC65B